MNELNDIKWSYDKANKQWFCLETFPYAKDGFTISKKKDGKYLLEQDYTMIHFFNKLSSAKLTARLLRFG